MHNWGDQNVDWQGIEEAASFIGDYLLKHGRISVMQTKEKYGTVRVYCYLGWESLHSITHPGYMYTQYPKILAELDYRIFGPIIRKFNKIVIPYQEYIYRKAYKKAIEKWPHLILEILDGADYDELLKGLSAEYDKYRKDNWVET